MNEVDTKLKDAFTSPKVGAYNVPMLGERTVLINTIPYLVF